MNAIEYQNECQRTDHATFNPCDAKILHGVLGCVTEAGELADALKKSLFYGRKIDRTNLLEELGDMCWYQSQILNQVGSTWEEIWAMNINKLRIRYPQQFTETQALIRNLERERQALEV